MVIHWRPQIFIDPGPPRSRLGARVCWMVIPVEQPPVELLTILMNHLLKDMILHPQKKNPFFIMLGGLSFSINTFHCFCSVVCFQPYEFTITMFGASTTAVSESAPRSTSVALLRWARWLSLERDSHPVDTTAKGDGLGKVVRSGSSKFKKTKELGNKRNCCWNVLHNIIWYDIISYNTAWYYMVWNNDKYLKK